jgi:hypothetical protein
MGVVIHRSRHAQEYVVVPNSIARNATLSFLARGLLVMLLSLPPDWHVTTDALAEDNPDSRTGIRAAMRELREAGYVQLLAERGKDGRTRRQLEVFDTPQPSAGTPRLVPPAQTRVPAGRTKRRIPTVGETAVKESTGPKYGAEVRENRSRPASQGQDHAGGQHRVGDPIADKTGSGLDRSAANSHNPRVHHGSNDRLSPTPSGVITAVGEQPQTVTRARGTCPHCGRDMSLTEGGTIRRHRDSATRGYCHGSGELPARAAP